MQIKWTIAGLIGVVTLFYASFGMGYIIDSWSARDYCWHSGKQESTNRTCHYNRVIECVNKQANKKIASAGCTDSTSYDMPSTDGASLKNCLVHININMKAPSFGGGTCPKVRNHAMEQLYCVAYQDNGKAKRGHWEALAHQRYECVK